MAQINRISKNNTVVLDNADGSRSVILHKTEVVRWSPENRTVTFNSGGWFTTTTRTRMVQAMHEWKLPLGVSFTKAGNVALHFVNGAEPVAFPFAGNSVTVHY